MKYEPYHALINAIILQAVKDYRTALDDENTSGIAECVSGSSARIGSLSSPMWTEKSSFSK